MVKPNLTLSFGINSVWLGGIDTTFLFCYSLGLYVSGILEDSYSMKLVVCSGMSLASLVFFFMIALGYFGIVSPWIFLISWGLQGLLQSTVWPGTVALIGNWFPKESHGGWMGLWSCNSSIGNIVGAQIASIIIAYNGRWELIILVTSIFMLASACATYIFIEDRPQGGSPTLRKGSINFWEAWKLPGVIEYSLAYGCIKMINYSLMMWLPYYLYNHIQATELEIVILVMLYELVGTGISCVAGMISDKMDSRVKVVMFLIASVIPVFVLFRFGSPETIWMYYILVPLSGALVVASSNLVTSCVATDLAYHTEVKKHTHAMATVTGIIDGTGSLGAAFGQILIGELQNLSWNYVFFFMMAVAATSLIILLFPLFESQKKQNEFSEPFIENIG